MSRWGHRIVHLWINLLTRLPRARRRRTFRYCGCVRPVDLQVIGEELAIKWDDGAESYIRLDMLRRACPCAGCKGEVDVMGDLHKGPDRPLSPLSFKWVRCAQVGTYAIQPVWGDGHSTGLFSFDQLRRLGSG